ncbi:TPA: hypothetical protein L5P36_006139, partial [Pseudomonas aeruginosa]|nr:hypothetical protein [Pseudomonas aeruginosa]HEH9466022.1 hypothetical protein [Pseudomonas aeruginosa]
GRKVITKSNLPKGYIPYSKVKLCSNLLSGSTFILSVDEVLPLLVGKGNKPQIWIQAIADANMKSFVPIVESSIPLFPFVRVTTESGVVLVFVNDQVIMSIRSEVDDEINIFQMDLRPIGLNIVGDEKSLRSGGMEFSNSTFSGMGTFMGFSL